MVQMCVHTSLSEAGYIVWSFARRYPGRVSLSSLLSSMISFCDSFKMKVLLLALAWTGLASAATAGSWSQCGGEGYTGPTSCASGFYCIALSSAYSLCEPWNGKVSEALPQQPSTFQTMASPKASASASSTVTITTTVPAVSSVSSTPIAASSTSAGPHQCMAKVHEILSLLS